MYYKIRNDIMFRQYEEHGYIADNSEFGYRMLNDSTCERGEKYVSQSGAVMLSVLQKEPKHIDDIATELSEIFVGVEKEILKEDAIEFYQYFCEEGYLSSGVTIEECVDCNLNVENNQLDNERSAIAINTDDCVKSIFKPDEFLRSIHIEIANACNECCVHCYIPHKYKTNTMDPELFYKIIDDGRKMNIIHVTLSGGEPLLHKDIIGFLEKCREMDLSVNVLSNLTALTDSVISEMIKNPLLSVQTSIYSMDPEIHDSITKLPAQRQDTIR